MSLLAVALVALLGTVVGIAARRSRQRFAEIEGAFRCRLRACGATPEIWPRLAQWWSRPMWAAWTGDVLVVRRGPVFARTVRLPATVTAAGVYALPPGDLKRCGDHPIAVCLRMPDDSRLEVAADSEARVALVGSYLAAAIHNLPPAPAPRRQR